MLKRFTSQELDHEFASAFGAVPEPRPAAFFPVNFAPQCSDATTPRGFRVNKLALAAVIAAIWLDTEVATMAKQALVTIATVPMSELATWAMMLVGLGMIGVAARRRDISGTQP